ncbi:MAG: divergent PAP2 family protein [Verrucomicrobia bacterium]|nr:divergent PAP2 family protein [Verrucomicrobiota bacterium]MBU1910618.1 divergent PAP2 family protein [Verrucomicrobiota bacterium]
MLDGSSWYQNLTFWSGVVAWVLAQVMKLFLYMRRTGRFDPAFMLRLGGMPSSHSATVTAVALSVGLEAGFGSTLFALALTFAIIVMIDAQSVRRAAGQQARLLNQIVDELFREHHFSQKKMVEFLGHTRLEVLFGMLLGIFTALLIHGWLGG